MKKPRFLVVDDDDSIQPLIRHYFSGANIETEFVNNGQAAVDSADSTKHDLVLLDVEMPGMDGKATAKQLRASGFRNVIVAFSGHDSQLIRKELLADGFDGVITKPFGDWDRLPTELLKFVELGRKDDDSFNRLRKEFLDRLPTRVQEMEAALKDSNWEKLLLEAHKLKGVAGGYGFQVVGLCAEVLEEEARKRPVNLALVSSELSKIKDFLTQKHH